MQKARRIFWAKIDNAEGLISMNNNNNNNNNHNHYKKYVKHLETIDVYRVLDLFDVTDPCEQHAVKKILCAGIRGAKTAEQDIQEAIDSLNRRLEMIEENKNKVVD